MAAFKRQRNESMKMRFRVNRIKRSPHVSRNTFDGDCVGPTISWLVAKKRCSSKRDESNLKWKRLGPREDQESSVVFGRKRIPEAMTRHILIHTRLQPGESTNNILIWESMLRMTPGWNPVWLRSRFYSSLESKHEFDLTQKQTPLSVNAAWLCKTLKAVVREELGRTWSCFIHSLFTVSVEISRQVALFRWEGGRPARIAWC